RVTLPGTWLVRRSVLGVLVHAILSARSSGRFSPSWPQSLVTRRMRGFAVEAGGVVGCVGSSRRMRGSEVLAGGAAAAGKLVRAVAVGRVSGLSSTYFLSRLLK